MSRVAILRIHYGVGFRTAPVWMAPESCSHESTADVDVRFSARSPTGVDGVAGSVDT